MSLFGRKCASLLRSRLAAPIHNPLLPALRPSRTSVPLRRFGSYASSNYRYDAQHAHDASLYEQQDAEILANEIQRNYVNPPSMNSNTNPYDSPSGNHPSLTPDELAIVHRPGIRTVKAFKFGANGDYIQCKFDLSRLRSVHPRDLVCLEDRGDVRRNGPVILPRRDCIIVSLSHVKAIIFHQSILLLDVDKPIVQMFAVVLSDFLRDSMPDPNDHERVDDNYATSFELRALEGTLRLVCDTYTRRLQCYSPVVASVLREMSTGQVDTKSIQRLLPLKDSLISFERAADELVGTLVSMIRSEPDMRALFLTARREWLLNQGAREVADAAAAAAAISSDSGAGAVTHTSGAGVDVSSVETHGGSASGSGVTATPPLRSPTSNPSARPPSTSASASASASASTSTKPNPSRYNNKHSMYNTKGTLFAPKVTIVPSHSFRLRETIPIPIEAQRDCELLLESFEREAIQLRAEATNLRKKIQAAEEFTRIIRDANRNKLIGIQAKTAVASLSVASGALFTGMFGMNLHSGLELSAFAFPIAAGISVGVPLCMYLFIKRFVMDAQPTHVNMANIGLSTTAGPQTVMIGGPIGGQRRADDLRMLRENVGRLGDVQDTLLQLSQGKHTLTRSELTNMIEVATNGECPDGLVDLIFKLYGNGSTLTIDEMRMMLCDSPSTRWTKTRYY